MTSVGTLNEFLSQKVRAIVSETQELVRGKLTVEPGHFKRTDRLSYAKTQQKYGALVDRCKVHVNEAGSAIAFTGRVIFYQGAFAEALTALKFETRVIFQFTATDYSHAGLNFHGIHLALSPLSIKIALDPRTLDEHYENDGLVQGIHMELLRHCDP
jgi:hypothetical protein